MTSNFNSKGRYALYENLGSNPRNLKPDPRGPKPKKQSAIVDLTGETPEVVEIGGGINVKTEIIIDSTPKAPVHIEINKIPAQVPIPRADGDREFHSPTSETGKKERASASKPQVPQLYPDAFAGWREPVGKNRSPFPRNLQLGLPEDESSESENETSEHMDFQDAPEPTSHTPNASPMINDYTMTSPDRTAAQPAPTDNDRAPPSSTAIVVTPRFPHTYQHSQTEYTSDQRATIQMFVRTDKPTPHTNHISGHPSFGPPLFQYTVLKMLRTVMHRGIENATDTQRQEDRQQCQIAIPHVYRILNPTSNQNDQELLHLGWQTIHELLQLIQQQPTTRRAHSLIEQSSLLEQSPAEAQRRFDTDIGRRR
jgi:hypothetical protein